MFLTCRSKGQIAELKVQFAANLKNYTISKPLSNDLRYDFIIDDGVKLHRVQVKYLNRKNKKNFELLLARKHQKTNPYKSAEIDLLLVYFENKDVILHFPPSIFHNLKKLTVNITNPKSKYYYENFIW